MATTNVDAAGVLGVATTTNYAAAAAAGLLSAAHQVIPLIVMGSVSTFVTAYDFLDGRIELFCGGVGLLLSGLP